MTDKLAKVDPEAKERAKKDKLSLELVAKLKKTAIDMYDYASRLEEVIVSGSTSMDGVWAWWVKCWEHKMQTGYTQDVARGRRVLRRMLRTIPANELGKAMINFFQHADDFTRRNGYPVEQFEKQVHSFRGPQRDGVAEELSDRGLFTDDPVG
jgi:hypothetical protein